MERLWPDSALNGLEIYSFPGHKNVRMNRVGVRRAVLPQWACEASVRQFRMPQFGWQTQRHAMHPTVDASMDMPGVEWLDDLMTAALPSLLRDFCRLYGIFEEEDLWLRETFAVCYEPTGKPGLELHRDSNLLSFVVLLSGANDFKGGGTVFDGWGCAPPVELDRGDALLFVGQRRHGAAAVTAGQRHILAGFIDVRTSYGRMQRICSEMVRLERGYVGSSCRELRRPWLTYNLHRLERCTGTRGRHLLEKLAARRSTGGGLIHVDLEPLGDGCARFLAGQPVDEPTLKFVTRVLGSDHKDVFVYRGIR